jgi:hypothetical protein
LRLLGSQDSKKADELQRAKLVEFFATLDLKSEIQPTTKKDGLPESLSNWFGSEENFWNHARCLQSLGNGVLRDSELVAKVRSLLEKDPLYFLILMHLHRQIRFTNLELVNVLFDSNRLDDANYYNDLMTRDKLFAGVVCRISKSKGLSRYLGAIPSFDQSKLQPTSEAGDSDTIRLAVFKKAVTSYLGSEERCWSLWESRIKCDPLVRKNIAKFVVENEDLKELVQEKAVVSALTRSLRIVNVELVKRERGEYGSKRVREILKGAGFRQLRLKRRTDISEVEKSLPSQSGYAYLREVPWKEQGKVFDFLLVHGGRIGFVVETNYFTTSMSKIREVVKHFRELKVACRRKYRLIYITDGMGWFNLMKTVKEMVEFEQKESSAEPSRIPYLMNLELFRREISEIKCEM